MRAQRPAGAVRHPILGPIMGIWAAHATDPELRHRASSGGVLSALNQLLLDEGEVGHILGAQAHPRDPRRTVPVQITSREDALRSAGSRYGPVAALGQMDLKNFSNTALSGKPCEASGVRAYARAKSLPPPIILSFFCAGTPQQSATDELIEELGLPADTPLADMWYRGRGWPGEFTAVAEDGRRVSTSYSDSWGAALGPTVQWRCRVCVDGVGESADISAGDFWAADEQGYPEFTDRPGRSVLIARTKRGMDLVERAVAAGVLELEPTSPDVAAAMQPYQTSRRELLVGRLLGTRLLLGKVPRYRGFGLVRMAAAEPKQIWREFRGTITRIRDRQKKGFRS